MTTIGLSYSLVKISTKCAPALGPHTGTEITPKIKSLSSNGIGGCDRQRRGDNVAN